MTKTEFTLLQDRSAGFITRMFAFIMDVAIVSGLVTLGGFIASMLDNATEKLGLEPAVSIGVIYVFMIPFICWAYYVMLWSLTGRTVGKWFMGLKVVSSHNRPPTVWHSTVRFLGYGVSAVVFWLGFAWVLVDEERQAWHDHFAKTWVIYDQRRHREGDIYETYSHQTPEPTARPTDSSSAQ